MSWTALSVAFDCRLKAVFCPMSAEDELVIEYAPIATIGMTMPSTAMVTISSIMPLKPRSLSRAARTRSKRRLIMDNPPRQYIVRALRW